MGRKKHYFKSEDNRAEWYCPIHNKVFSVEIRNNKPYGYEDMVKRCVMLADSGKSDTFVDIMNYFFGKKYCNKKCPFYREHEKKVQEGITRENIQVVGMKRGKKSES
jgi:hypothetical protein